MDRYIFASKETRIDERLKDFIFVFNDATSKKVFEQINKGKDVQALLLDERLQNSQAQFFIGDKDVYMIYVLPKLLDLNISNISIYDEKKFPNKLQIVQNDIKEIYDAIEIDSKQTTFIITKELVERIRYGTILAKKVVDASVEMVMIEIDLDGKIYEIAGTIKNLNSDIPIAIVGKSDTPKKTLMTNPVDFLLPDRTKAEDLLDALDGKRSFEDVHRLYYYDADLSVRFNG